MKANLFTLLLIKIKNETNASIKIKIIKNYVNDLMNKELIIKKN